MYWLAFVVFFAVSVPSAFGQTVSILNGGEDPASKAVKAAISQTLRAKGYTVKAGSTEGFVLLLNVRKAQTMTGTRAGLAGNLTIVSMQGERAALALSKPCQAERAVAQRLQDTVGTRLTQINSTIVFAPTAEGLADLLSWFSHNAMQGAAQTVDARARQAQKLKSPMVRP